MPQGKRTLLVSLLLQWARDSGAFEDEHGESVYLSYSSTCARKSWQVVSGRGLGTTPTAQNGPAGSSARTTSTAPSAGCSIVNQRWVPPRNTLTVVQVSES